MLTVARRGARVTLLLAWSVVGRLAAQRPAACLTRHAASHVNTSCLAPHAALHITPPTPPSAACARTLWTPLMAAPRSASRCAACCAPQRSRCAGAGGRVGAGRGCCRGGPLCAALLRPSTRQRSVAGGGGASPLAEVNLCVIAPSPPPSYFARPLISRSTGGGGAQEEGGRGQGGRASGEEGGRLGRPARPLGGAHRRTAQSLLLCSPAPRSALFAPSCCCPLPRCYPNLFDRTAAALTARGAADLAHCGRRALQRPHPSPSPCNDVTV